MKEFIEEKVLPALQSYFALAREVSACADIHLSEEERASLEELIASEEKWTNVVMTETYVHSHALVRARDIYAASLDGKRGLLRALSIKLGVKLDPVVLWSTAKKLVFFVEATLAFIDDATDQQRIETMCLQPELVNGSLVFGDGTVLALCDIGKAQFDAVLNRLVRKSKNVKQFKDISYEKTVDIIEPPMVYYQYIWENEYGNSKTKPRIVTSENYKNLIKEVKL